MTSLQWHEPNIQFWTFRLFSWRPWSLSCLFVLIDFIGVKWLNPVFFTCFRIAILFSFIFSQHRSIFGPFTSRSIPFGWDHPGAHENQQSICPPLKLDCSESACALLRLNRDTPGITWFQSSIRCSCWRKRDSPSRKSPVQPVNHTSQTRPPLPRLAFSSSHCLFLDRATQTKWLSKWAAACQRWSKSCRSSPPLPRRRQSLAFLSSEWRHCFTCKHANTDACTFINSKRLFMKTSLYSICITCWTHSERWACGQMKGKKKYFMIMPSILQ